ncbi:MAG: carboxypeptidase-like regulatory domain-containing protein [Gracilimonas sp.]
MRVLLFILCLLTINNTAIAQSEKDSSNSYSLTLRSVSVEEALIELSNISNIDIAYDSKLDLGKLIYISERDKPVEDILKKILSFSDLDYIILSTGTYVITSSPSKKPEYSSFSGYVRDSETGEPLPNATVLIADASGATATNRNGYFNISSLISGEYEVQASFVGYESKRRKVTIGPESNSFTIIELAPKSYMMEPLVVSSNTPDLRINPAASGTSFNSITENYVGADRNVIQSLRAFSGVTFSEGQQSFNIQGSDSRDHLVKLDNVPIYNSTIAGNTFGIFSPYSIDRIEIMKSGFEADKGSALSGFIDFKHDLEDRSESSAILQADPYAVNARIEAPFLDGSAWNSMIGARINIWDAYQAPALSGTFDQWNRLDPLLQNFIMGDESDIAHYDPSIQNSDVAFYDLHFAMERSSDPYSNFLISGYYGKSLVDTKLLSERITINSQQPHFFFSEDKATQSNSMLNIEQSGILTARTDYWLKAYYTYSKFENNYRMIGDDDLAQNGANAIDAYEYFSDLDFMPGVNENENTIKEISLSAGLKYNLNSKSELEIGLDPRFITYNFKLSDLFYFPTATSGESFIFSSFSQFSHSPNNQTKLTFGTRGTYLPNGNSFHLEPRFSAEYNSDETASGYHSIKLSTGIYNQFINRFDLSSFGPTALIPSYKFWLPNDRTTEVPRSYHTSFSWSVTPSDKFLLSFESYYKRKAVNWRLNYHELLQPQTSSGVRLADQNSYLSRSSGFSYGGAITTEVRFTEPRLTLNVMHQVNVSKEKIEDRFNGEMVHTEWSEPYALSTFINWYPFENFNALFNIKWVPVKYWGFNKAYYNYLGIHGETNFGEFDLTSPETSTLPYHLQLDLGFNYSFKFSDQIKFETRLDLVNIMNRKNPVYYTLTPHSGTGNQINYQRDQRTLPGFSPSLSVEISF